MAIKPSNELWTQEAYSDAAALHGKDLRHGAASPGPGNATGALLPHAYLGSIALGHSHMMLMQQWLAANNATVTYEEDASARRAALTTLAADLVRRSGSAEPAAAGAQAAGLARAPGGPHQRPLLLSFEADAVLRPGFEERLREMLQQVQAFSFDNVNLCPPDRMCRLWRDRSLAGRMQLLQPVWGNLVAVGTLWSLPGGQKLLAHLPTSVIYDVYLQHLMRAHVLNSLVSCDRLIQHGGTPNLTSVRTRTNRRYSGG